MQTLKATRVTKLDIDVNRANGLETWPLDASQGILHVAIYIEIGDGPGGFHHSPDCCLVSVTSSSFPRLRYH